MGHFFYHSTGNLLKGSPGVFELGSTDSVVGPFAGYAEVDDPDSAPTTIIIGTTSSGNIGTVSDRVMAGFTARAGAPEDVRIGIAVDGLDGGAGVFTPDSLGIRQTNGAMGSLEVVLTSQNNTLDMIFFDVTGIQNGDTFEIFADTSAAGGGHATHAFVTFDSLTLVPEPSSFLCVGLGLLGIGLRQSRRRSARNPA